MTLLDDTNEWEPEEITLKYKVYKDLLAKVASYPDIIKSLTENGTHILVKQNSGPGSKEAYALITRNDFEKIRHQFNM